MRHRLLVVRAIDGKNASMRVKRLANARDVAVSEDRENAAEERLARRCLQRGEVSDQRLGGRQTKRAAHSAAQSARVDAQASISASNVRRTRAMSSPSSMDPVNHARLGSWYIAFPTMKPRHVFDAAAALKPSQSSSRPAADPGSTTPRQAGSRSAIS